MSKPKSIFLLLCLVLLSSCSSAGDAIGDQQVKFADNLPAKIKPGDSLVIEGIGAAESEMFTFEEGTLVRLAWNKDQASDFTINIVSVADESVVRFAYQTEELGGSGDWIFSPGSYQIEVISSDNVSWQIVLDIIDNMESPFDS